MFYSPSTKGFYSSDLHGKNMPGDCVYIEDDHHASLLLGQSFGKRIVAGDGGFPTLIDPPGPTAEQIQSRFAAEIQARLDDFAKTRNYDSILSACTYATSSIPKFRDEGQYCVDARDATWSAAYAILAEVMSGARHMPDSIDSIAADLPPLAWPQP